MAEPIVIIHGWSDGPSSFKKLAGFIQTNLAAEVSTIDLSEWVSMNDDVSYPDIAEAMNRAWNAHGLPTKERVVNVVVHSTGALIVREWMTRYFTSDTVPIKRFLMLAPANFGSPLAHKGRSFIGRAFKGWGNDGFETGKKVLKGLELASPYTWELAHKDLFTDKCWYGKNKILATVLIGNEGYDGLRSIANETGSDGTVRISTANLNATRIRLELSENQTPIKLDLVYSNGQIGFGIVNKFNHGSITLGETQKPDRIGLLEQLILGALTVSDQDFERHGASFPWQTQIDKVVGETAIKSPRMQNVVVKASDNLGNKIEDYFVEFYRSAQEDTLFEQRLYTKFINDVHAYGDDGAFRSLYLNIAELEKMTSLKAMSIDNLYISITAQPIFKESNKKHQPVGYLPLDSDSAGGLEIHGDQINTVFQPHKTMLIEVVLTRKLSEDVFRLDRVRGQQ